MHFPCGIHWLRLDSADYTEPLTVEDARDANFTLSAHDRTGKMDNEATLVVSAETKLELKKYRPGSGWYWTV